MTFCPRCGEDPEVFTPEKIMARLKEIPLAPALTAQEKVFEKRLETCEACEALREKILCAHCGCFVLFRARPAQNYCPHPTGDKWRLH